MPETLKIKLILCPIDFSEFSVSAYQHALSVAEHYQAKLVAQHIVEMWRHPSGDFAATAGVYAEFSQALRESGKEQLQEFVKKHTHDEIQPELLVQVGVAADSILSFAQSQETDVIVTRCCQSRCGRHSGGARRFAEIRPAGTEGVYGHTEGTCDCRRPCPGP